MVKRKLGRGLGELLGNDFSDEQDRITQLDVKEIEANPYQPRREFDKEALQELADSIREKGILQPVIVRRTGSTCQIIAGERRWRAACLAGLTEIPAIIRETDDRDMAELALVENLQREDLTAVEEARAYEYLRGEYGLTQEEVADRVGKSRPHVANTMRLLALPEEIQQMLLDRKLTPGQARPLLSLATPAEQLAMARKIIREGLSARDIEKRLSGGKKEKPAGKDEPRVSEYLRSVEQELAVSVGSKIKIQIGRGRNAHRGTIVISFKNDDDFQRITDILKQKN